MSTETQHKQDQQQDFQPHQRAHEVDLGHVMTRQHYERMAAELKAQQQ